MFLFELTANATMDRYFWGGLAFGARRFVDLAVPFGLGLWWFVKAFPARFAYPLLVGAVGWSVSLAGSAMIGRLGLLHDVSWPALIRNVADLRWILAIDTPTLNSPVTFPQAIPHALIALGLVLLFWVGTVFLVRRPRLTLGLILAAIIASGGFVLSMLEPSRAAASGELERYEIDRPLAMRAGPLLDQRALLFDELEYYRRAGRETSAERTLEELQQIDRTLREHGLTR